jgi:F0F1-type ATP synthase assembly protein I
VKEITSAGKSASKGAGNNFDFFGSVIAGFLLGYGADWLFDSAPVGVVIGIVAGSVAGFYKLYRVAEEAEEEWNKTRTKRWPRD